jgi:thioredoxin 1
MSVARWNPEELEGVVASGRPVLVDLRADWCRQCAPQEQVVERLLPSYEGEVAIGSVDVGDHPEVSERYEILGLPAFLLFNGGDHKETVNGFRRAPELRAVISKLLVGAKP